jgi:hypothetical protein
VTEEPAHTVCPGRGSSCKAAGGAPVGRMADPDGARIVWDPDPLEALDRDMEPGIDMNDYRESAAEFAALNEPAKKRVYTEVANDLRDATSIPLDKLAPHVLTRLAMTRHHEKLFNAVFKYYLDEKADLTYQRLTQCLYKPAPVEKGKTREIEPNDPSKREESDENEQPSEVRVLGGDPSTSRSRPAGRSGDADELEEIASGKFAPSVAVPDTLSRAVLTWMGSSPAKVRADFTKHVSTCHVDPPTDEYQVTQSILSLKRARRIWGEGEFVLRKGTSHPAAKPDDEWFPLTQGIVDMLERWAQTVPIFAATPRAKSGGATTVDFFARQSRHTYRKLFQLVHQGPSLVQFQTLRATKEKSMEELIDGYCFQTGGSMADLKRNSFVGCIPVSITAKGNITVIPCGDGIEASAKEAFHAGVAKHFGKDKPTEKAEKAEKAKRAAVYTSDCKKYTLFHPCFPFQARVFPAHVPIECNPPYWKYFQLEFDPAGCVPPAEIKAGYPYFCYSTKTGQLTASTSLSLPTSQTRTAP